MTNSCQRPWKLVVALGMVAAVSFTSGCQTWFPDTGQTLPSGYYLHHAPQFNPPTPSFPQPREEAGLEQANNQANAILLPPR